MHAAASPTAAPDPSTREGALAQLFDAHHGRVFGAAYRITGSAQDAEDVLQTVFLRLMRRDQLDLAPNPGSYLYRAGVNAAIDLMRAKSGNRALPLDELTAAPPSQDPLDDPERRQRDRDVRRCLRSGLLALGAKAAEAFSLRYFEGLSNRDIATVTDSTPTAVGVLLHRSRKQLRKQLASCLGGLT
ncbi:MAG: sigma-70 family RNA polymerase sigma factor [Acidobacteriota bacterium]